MEEGFALVLICPGYIRSFPFCLVFLSSGWFARALSFYGLFGVCEPVFFFLLYF